MENDILVIDRAIKPRHKMSVAALVDGDFKVKQRYQRDGRVKLQAAFDLSGHSAQGRPDYRYPGCGHQLHLAVYFRLNHCFAGSMYTLVDGNNQRAFRHSLNGLPVVVIFKTKSRGVAIKQSSSQISKGPTTPPLRELFLES